MLRLQRWSTTAADPTGLQSFNDITQVEAEKSLAAVEDTSTSWTTTFVILQSDDAVYISPAIDTIYKLLQAFAYAPPDAVTSSDTVNSNLYLSDWQPGNCSRHVAARRTYSVSDNTFGVCWTWDPIRHVTKGLMYGQAGEGSRQVQHIINGLDNYRHLHTSPLLPGLLSLEAEVNEMKQWIVAQSHALMEAHVETGHHSYANAMRRLDLTSVDMAKLSRDVCGLAVNLSSSALCLSGIVKLADFLLDECIAVWDDANRIPQLDLRVLEALDVSNGYIEAYAQAWQRRADRLHDEAETWKHKASIIVQTVFTLTTQRDQDISIQIAYDSRTLAQKATRDSNSMKAIAAVTMCFLPGTLVASLFAMPMFDRGASEGKTVSSHFWMYWAVTVPLTIIVLMSWILWTNRREVLKSKLIRGLISTEEKAASK